MRGKGGRCVRPTTLPPSCADCLEVWESETPGSLRACPGLYWDCFAFHYTHLITLQNFTNDCASVYSQLCAVDWSSSI